VCRKCGPALDFAGFFDEQLPREVLDVDGFGIGRVGESEDRERPQDIRDPVEIVPDVRARSVHPGVRRVGNERPRRGSIPESGHEEFRSEGADGHPRIRRPVGHLGEPFLA
jgi:hypothetical protein